MILEMDSPMITGDNDYPSNSGMEASMEKGSSEEPCQNPDEQKGQVEGEFSYLSFFLTSLDFDINRTSNAIIIAVSYVPFFLSLVVEGGNRYII